MYYSKENELIYLSNAEAKVFIGRDYLDYVHKNGTIRYTLLNDWEISYYDGLPVMISSADITFRLDVNQQLVKSMSNFELEMVMPLICLKPNAFFKLLIIFKRWHNVKDVDLNISNTLNVVMTIYEKAQKIHLTHCKLIHLQTQHIKI